jgi:hypothetical protein
MAQEHDRRRAADGSRRNESMVVQHPLAPGKRTLTEAAMVQRSEAITGARLAAVETGAPASASQPISTSTGPRPTLQMLFGVQRAAMASPAEDPAQVHAAAARGTATPATKLPYRESIQRAFGRHDISAVHAHIGTEAAASAREMGARAYATGDHVVLGESVDLHTVAHEAAHVVQQRGAVQLKGGACESGDAYEREADEVADRVVRGESAEQLLRRHDGAPAAAGVQRLTDEELMELKDHISKKIDEMIEDSSLILFGDKRKKCIDQIYNEVVAACGEQQGKRVLSAAKKEAAARIGALEAEQEARLAHDNKQDDTKADAGQRTGGRKTEPQNRSGEKEEGNPRESRSKNTGFGHLDLAAVRPSAPNFARTEITAKPRPTSQSLGPHHQATNAAGPGNRAQDVIGRIEKWKASKGHVGMIAFQLSQDDLQEIVDWAATQSRKYAVGVGKGSGVYQDSCQLKIIHIQAPEIDGKQPTFHITAREDSLRALNVPQLDD